MSNGGRTKTKPNRRTTTKPRRNGPRTKPTNGRGAAGSPKIHRIESDGKTVRLAATGTYRKFVTTHRATSLAELQDRKLIPAFVSMERLNDALRETNGKGFGAGVVDERVDSEMTRAGAAGNAWSSAFKASRRKAIETDVAIDAISSRIRGNRSKQSVELAAGRALALKKYGHLDVVEMAFPGRLEVLAPTVIDDSLTSLRAEEIVIGRGLSLMSEAASFLLIANSLAGPGCIDVTGRVGESGLDGPDGIEGSKGTAGRKAECKGIFGKDTPPTNGSAGSAGSNGGAGGAGESGAPGGTWEIHTEVLGTGICVHADGGQGGDGGSGGDGGDGGQGGKGGYGNDCEPSGNGGKGGDGGNGGKGGAAGNGGSAGRIFLYYVSDQSHALPPVLTASGGLPGRPGVGGKPGAGGAAGDPGNDSKYGKARWDPGAPKSAGASGDPGASGATGSPGASTAQNIVRTQVATI